MAACALSDGGAPGTPGAYDSGAPVDSGDTGGGDASTFDASTDAGPIDSGVDAPMVDTGACDPAKCPGARCVGTACGFFKDCNDLHTSGAFAAPTGTYSFHAKDNYDAYCDMDTAGGGWTLVGRSVFGGSGMSFGWGKSTGVVSDDGNPYSLDAIAHGLSFASVMLTTYTTGKNLATEYTMNVPSGFPAGYGGKSGATSSVDKASNFACTIGGSNPSQFGTLGYTDKNDHFYVGDATADSTGLYAGGYNFPGGFNCDVSGGYASVPNGMIFVK